MFSCGISSGDPTADSITLRTRVDSWLPDTYIQLEVWRQDTGETVHAELIPAGGQYGQIQP